jgi:hypothetical protein
MKRTNLHLKYLVIQIFFVYLQHQSFIFVYMNATIDISYNQMLLLLQQMPIRSQLRIGKALTRQNIRAELNHFLETFRTDELSEAEILAEVKAVRRERHAKKA